MERPIAILLIGAALVLAQSPCTPFQLCASFPGIEGRGPSPDLSIAVGPLSMLLSRNAELVLRTKTGALIAEADAHTLFAPVIPRGSGFLTDQYSLYDDRTGRFFLVLSSHKEDPTCEPGTCVAVQLLAVSKSFNPSKLEPSDWHLYAFDRTTRREPGGVKRTTEWGDYDRLSIIGNTLVITCNNLDLRTGTPGLAMARFLPIDKLVRGEPVADWTDLSNAPDHVAINYGDAARAFFVRVTEGGYRITGVKLPAGSEPPVSVDVAVVSGPAILASPPQPDYFPPLGVVGGGGARLHYVHRNDRLWLLNTPGEKREVTDVMGISWAELDVSSWPSVRLVQSGVVREPGVWSFTPALMADNQGNIVIVYGRSGLRDYPAAWYTGRLSTDPPGTLRPPRPLKSGVSTYLLPDAPNRNQYLDYSHAAWDSQDNSLWIHGMYVRERDKSASWVGQLRLAPSSENSASQRPAEFRIAGGVPERIDFGVLIGGTAAEKVILIENPGGSPLSGVAEVDEPFTVEPRAITVPAGGSLAVLVRLRAAPLTSPKGVLRLRTLAGNRDFDVTASATAAPPPRGSGYCLAFRRNDPITPRQPGFTYHMDPALPPDRQLLIRTAVERGNAWARENLGAAVERAVIFAFASKNYLLRAYQQETGLSAREVEDRFDGCEFGFGSGQRITPGALYVYAGPFSSMEMSVTWRKSSSILKELFDLLNLQLAGRLNRTALGWLVEGASEFAAIVAVSDWSLGEYESIRASQLEAARIVTTPLAVTQPAGTGAHFGYFFLAVERLAGRAGVAKLSHFFRLLGQGRSDGSAFLEAFGQPLDNFYADFQAHFASLLATLPPQPAPGQPPGPGQPPAPQPSAPPREPAWPRGLRFQCRVGQIQRPGQSQPQYLYRFRVSGVPAEQITGALSAGLTVRPVYSGSDRGGPYIVDLDIPINAPETEYTVALRFNDGSELHTTFRHVRDFADFSELTLDPPATSAGKQREFLFAIPAGFSCTSQLTYEGKRTLTAPPGDPFILEAADLETPGVATVKAVESEGGKSASATFEIQPLADTFRLSPP